MKTILNLIFAIVVLGFSMNTFAGNPAPGVDPNLPISSTKDKMEAGTGAVGFGCNTCPGFINQNDILSKSNTVPTLEKVKSTLNKVEGQN